MKFTINLKIIKSISKFKIIGLQMTSSQIDKDQIFEKNIFISFCDSTMPKIWWARKPIVENIDSCFLLPLKMRLYIFHIHLVLSQNSQVFSVVHLCWQLLQIYSNYNLCQFLNQQNHNHFQILLKDANGDDTSKAQDIMNSYHILQL